MPPIEPFNKQEVSFCIPVESLSSSFSFNSKAGRVTGMHKEEEARLRRQLKLAEVNNEGRNDYKRRVTTSRAREKRESGVKCYAGWVETG